MRKKPILLLAALIVSVTLLAQERRAPESITQLKAPVLIQFSKLAAWEAAHPRRVKHKFIEQGEDREREYVFPPEVIPPDALRFTVPDAASRPAGAQVTGGPSPAPTTQFNGIMDNGSTVPPDIRGAAGLNHIMETTNQEFKIYSKTGSLISTLSLNGFFAGGGGQNGSYFDPHVAYDNLRNRFLVCTGGNLANGHSGFFLAVSATGDPTGAWSIFNVDGTGNSNDLLDYPLMGFNNNWIVLTGNDFVSGGSTVGKIFVFDRDSIYHGAGAVYTFVDGNVFSMAPALTLDSTQSVEYMVQNANGNSSGHGYVRLASISGVRGAPVYSFGTLIGVSRTWSGNNVGVPQSGSTHTVEDGDARISNAVFINGSLWLTHCVFVPAASPTHDAVDWWQINPVGPAVVQFGRIEDTTGVNFYFYPSLSVNYSGDMLLGYCQSSAQMFASASYSFRAAGDPLNTTQDNYLYKAGFGPYYKTFGGTRNRWGDYTTTALDPVNGSFWNFGQWANSGNAWGTVIANVLSSNDTTCYGPVGLLVDNVTDTSADLSWVPVSGAPSFVVQHRPSGTMTWTSDTITGWNLHLSGLTGSTVYEWQVLALCGAGNPSSGGDSLVFRTRTSCAVPDPAGQPATTCSGNSVQLSGSGNGVLNWFADSVTTVVLDTGTVYVTPPLTATQSYFIESQVPAPGEQVGPPDSALGTGAILTIHNYRNLFFRCDLPVRLVSVKVYAQGTASRNILLRQNGATLRSVILTIPDGESRVLLNFDIPAGTGFELGCQGNTNMYYSTSGAAYPYSIDGLVSITGNNVDPDQYYYFYDWEVQEQPCRSNRVRVDATVRPTPVAGFSVTTAVDTAFFTDLSSGTTRWLWTFGDSTSGSADTSSLQHPVHIYSSLDSVYAVCLVTSDTVSGCADTLCRSILVGGVGLAAVDQAPAAIYPNPAKGSLTIQFSASWEGFPVTVRLINTAGQVVLEQPVDRVSRGHRLVLDLTAVSPGMYAVSVQGTGGTWIQRVVKQ